MEMKSDQHPRALLATNEKHPCLVVTPLRQQERNRTYVVVGVERGGTSMVAGVMRALGVNMGTTAGLNHEDPRFISDDLDKQRKAIRVNNKSSEVWGFKMPKAALSLDFYASELRNPCFVVVFRNIASIADSWQQRGTGSYLGSIDRAVRYYSAISDFLHNTKRPVIIVNYERATEMREETVAGLAAFAGIELTDEIMERGLEMITGDGKGYVNLPEHHFRVLPVAEGAAEPPEDATPIRVEDNAASVTGPDGWIEFDNLKKVLEFVQPDEAPFPERFWIDIDLDPGSVKLDDDPVRIYFNYIGRYFPGHCARPRLQRGRNRLFVETSGLARGVAIGPLKAGVRMKVSATFQGPSSPGSQVG